MIFPDLNLLPSLCQNLQKLGFLSPTPIQQHMIPAVLRGNDVLASAQTGTGKTGAFLLPLIDLLIKTRRRNRLARAIILEPTRELALQVMQNFQSFVGDFSSLNGALLVGGESLLEQQRTLSRGVDVLIATPGRLLDLIDRGQILLPGIQHVVIDEADHMLDMGFVPDINRLMPLLPKQRQTLLLSATFPGEIKKLADNYLNSPCNIHLAPAKDSPPSIKQHFINSSPLKKPAIISYLIERFGANKPSIIFCNRKRDIATLAQSLKNNNYGVGTLHGDLSQDTRSETVKQFKDGKIKVLVASSIVARGLDVDNLGLVINFEVPLNGEDYIHRIGRTGRAGQEGYAFILSEDKDSKALALIAKNTKQEITTFEIPPTILEGTIAIPPVKKDFLINKDSSINSKGGAQHNTDLINVLPKKRLVESTSNTNLSIKRNYTPVQKINMDKIIIGFGDFTPAFMLQSLDFSPLGNCN